MAPHQERVVQEEIELADKLAKLDTFLLTELFASLDEREQVRLRLQRWFMAGYLDILQERIEAFE